VVTVHTGSPLAEWTLTAIPELLQLERFSIIVYIPRESHAGFDRLRKAAGELLPQGTRAEFRPLNPPYCTQLLREVSSGRVTGTVILPCEPPEFQGGPLRELLNGISVPVLLVRRVTGARNAADQTERGSASGE
jgi:hypothetical protein